MTATAERTERVRFIARGLGAYRLIVEPREEKITALGKKVTVSGTGKVIEFTNGDASGLQTYETDDPAEIEFLRLHPSFGSSFHEQPIPKPPSAPTLSRVAELAAAGDVESLVALYEEEEQGHRRTDVLQTAAASLKALESRE